MKHVLVDVRKSEEAGTSKQDMEGGKTQVSEALHDRELTVWRKSMDAAKEVYRLVPKLPREETCGMRSQLTRAAISVPANIVEGWTRESAREKAHFLAVA